MYTSIMTSGLDCMDSGWVYILSNRCMPGLVKVGFTTTSVEQRVLELSNTTSAPMAFDIEAIYPTLDVRAAERNTHLLLDAFRFNPNREFFQLSPKAASYLVENGIAVRRDTTDEVSELTSANIGEAIKNARRKAGLTQHELAKLTGICETRISRYERGENITVQQLSKLFAPLNIGIALAPRRAA
jgi:DNA-binding XRE family transcriptional regulator